MTPAPSRRQLKAAVEAALRQPGSGWQEHLARLMAGADLRTLAGILLGHLLHPDELARWRAAEAFGLLLPALAEADMPAARELVRKLLWRLNEESGNMGWGAGEALGAGLAAHLGLAREYARILRSYVQHKGNICHGNFLDNPRLRHGVWWGLARIAASLAAGKDAPALLADLLPGLPAELLAVLSPELAVENQPDTPDGAGKALECHDAQARGLACLLLGILAPLGVLDAAAARPALQARLADAGPLRLYWDDQLNDATVAQLAARALRRLPGAPQS